MSVGGCGRSHLPHYLLGGLSLGLRSGDGDLDLDWEEREASMAGPGGTAAPWIRPSVSICAVPHPMWAGDVWVEERFCLEGGQLGTF